jgi:hypothetical protein
MGLLRLPKMPELKALNGGYNGQVTTFPRTCCYSLTYQETVTVEDAAYYPTPK